MAVGWIKIENVTPDKPEVFQLAERLGIDPDAALGKLIRVWVWADEQTYDGNAGSVTRLLLDRVAGVSGFAEALIDVGWLVADDGKLVIPNFDRHNGQTAKTRALTTRRVQTHRSKCNGDVTPGPLPTRNGCVTREEKRREEYKPPIVPQGTSAGDGEKPDETPKEPTPDQRRFAAFWAVVHCKTAKDAARKAYHPAVRRVAAERECSLDEAAEYIRERMTAFAKTPSARPKDRSPVHPATWLNGGRYDDDPAAWGSVKYDHNKIDLIPQAGVRR